MHCNLQILITSCSVVSLKSLYYNPLLKCKIWDVFTKQKLGNLEFGKLGIGNLGCYQDNTQLIRIYFSSFVCLMVFNATFINISVISWRSFLFLFCYLYLEKTIDLSQVIDKLYHNVVLSITLHERDSNSQR